MKHFKITEDLAQRLLGVLLELPAKTSFGLIQEFQKLEEIKEVVHDELPKEK